MRETAADLARRLAQNAEAVCREYLSNGRREGSTWRVGDVENTPGRSLMVRLVDGTSGVAGKWIDFATGEHGDLLDLIARVRRLDSFRDVAEEARRFLSLPETVPTRAPPASPGWVARGRTAAVRRRQADPRHHRRDLPSQPGHQGRARPQGAAVPPDTASTAPARMPRARPGRHCSPPSPIPAGMITGVLRTWLARDGSGKAPIATPRRAMGHLLGNGVRFGTAQPAPAKAGVIAAGEGLETMLALRCVLPGMPMVAALSATHLAALVLPAGLQRLYVARDNDRAGRRAARDARHPRQG